MKRRPSMIKPAAFPAAAGEPRQTAAAVVNPTIPGGVCVLFQFIRRRVPRFNIATIREQAMRNRQAAEVNADVEARIAQIEQMTLDQIGVFSVQNPDRDHQRKNRAKRSERLGSRAQKNG